MTCLLNRLDINLTASPLQGLYRLYHPGGSQKRIPNRYAWYGGVASAQKVMGSGWRVSLTPVHCYPLYSLLLASNLTVLDLLSLDLEGSEPYVLATLPWDKIDVKVSTLWKVFLFYFIMFCLILF